MSFLLAPTCLIEKVTLWEDLLRLAMWSETDESVAKDKFVPQTGNRTKSSTLSTQPSLHLIEQSKDTFVPAHHIYLFLNIKQDVGVGLHGSEKLMN